MKKFRYLIYLLHILLFLYYRRLNFILDRLVGNEYGLCYYLKEFSLKTYKNPINGIVSFCIPEFRSKYLAGKSTGYGSYWWDIEDKEIRLKAFEKLIVLYKSKIKNLCLNILTLR